MKLSNSGGVIGFAAPLLVVAIFGGTVFGMPFWVFAFATLGWAVAFPYIFFELKAIKDEVDFFYYIFAVLGLMALTASHLDEEKFVVETRGSELRQMIADLDLVLTDPAAFLSDNDVRTRLLESLTKTIYYRSNPIGSQSNCDLYPRQELIDACEARRIREGYARRLHSAILGGKFGAGLQKDEIAAVFEGAKTGLFQYPDMLFERYDGVSTISIFEVYMSMEAKGSALKKERALNDFVAEVLKFRNRLSSDLESAEQKASVIIDHGKPDRTKIVVSRIWAFLLLIALGLKIARNKVQI